MKNSGNVLMHTELEEKKSILWIGIPLHRERAKTFEFVFGPTKECFVCLAHIWYCFKLRCFFIGIIFTKHSPLKSRLDTVLFTKFCVQQATLVVRIQLQMSAELKWHATFGLMWSISSCFSMFNWWKQNEIDWTKERAGLFLSTGEPFLGHGQ